MDGVMMVLYQSDTKPKGKNLNEYELRGFLGWNTLTLMIWNEHGIIYPFCISSSARIGAFLNHKSSK